MSRGTDAAGPLARRIVADGARAGLGVTVVEARATRWASATFVGARHRLVLAITGAAEAWLAALPEAELPIGAHLVADLAVVAVEPDEAGCRATIEVLTVEDA